MDGSILAVICLRLNNIYHLFLFGRSYWLAHALFLHVRISLVGVGILSTSVIFQHYHLVCCMQNVWSFYGARLHVCDIRLLPSAALATVYLWLLQDCLLLANGALPLL